MIKFQQYIYCFQKEDIAPVFGALAFEITLDEGEQAVLPVEFKKLMPSMARVPIMFGICEREGVFGFCGKVIDYISTFALYVFRTKSQPLNCHMN